MSGPKVVRIVTREEIIALCESHLRRLDAFLERWARTCRAASALTDEDEAAARRRRNAIEAMLGADRFMDLQKAVPDEIAFLKADRDARLEKAAIAKARARTYARREAEARALLKAAAATSPSQDAAKNERLRKLAEALKEGAGEARKLDVLAPPATKEDGAFERIEVKLAEVEVFIGDAAVWQARLETVRAEVDADRRALLLDSLSLDLGKVLADGRRLVGLREDLALALAELADTSAERRAALGEVAVETLAAEAAGTMLKAVQDALVAARAEAAAAARRAAVLQGLAALGYEVTEGLSTAWVKEGRVVLRRPAQPGYGVELAGGAEASKVQMQVVAFGGEADPARDRDAESRWCGDIAGLSASLATSGTELVIERALAAGARPVKRLAAGADERFAAREGAASDRERRL